MEIKTKCKWCKKHISFDSEETNLGHKREFCSLNCNEEFYLRYRCGFKPRKYATLPYIELSEKLILEMLLRTKDLI